MKISSKKHQELWSVVHDEVMMARIKISRILSGKDKDRTVDDVLFTLSINAPQRACDCFRAKEKQT
jgi:hypothetical protein